MQCNKAFTMIELVVVIVLLGILASVAVPKFFDLTTDAHKASVQGAASAFAVGVDLYQKRYQIRKSYSSSTDYPPGAKGWIDGYAMSQEDCRDLYNDIVSENTEKAKSINDVQGLHENLNTLFYAWKETGGAPMGCYYFYAGDLPKDADIVTEATFGFYYSQLGKVERFGPSEESDGKVYFDGTDVEISRPGA